QAPSPLPIAGYSCRPSLSVVRVWISDALPSRKLSILRYRTDLTAARVGIDRIRSGLGIFDRDRNGIEAALVGPFGEDGLIGMISV
ncbi:unnamed protein product, partial [Musa banksii]